METKKNKISKSNVIEKDTFEFRVSTARLLEEIASCALPKSMGVLKIPLNVFRIQLAKLAECAAKLDDPELNICCLNLDLYEVDPLKIVEQINIQKQRIKDKKS